MVGSSRSKASGCLIQIRAKQRETLPAAAEGAERTVVERLRRVEIIEHGAHAPGFLLATGRRQGAAQHLGERQAEQRGRHVLLDVAQAGAAREHDAAFVRLDRAGDTAQQGGFARAVAGDEADPVARAEADGEILEKRAGA